MTRKKVTKLSCKPKKTARLSEFKPTSGYLWIDTYKELLSAKSPYSVKTVRVKTCSPAHTQARNRVGVKRRVHTTPLKSPLKALFVKTPSKSPFRKKVKRCLSETLKVDAEKAKLNHQHVVSTPNDDSVCYDECDDEGEETLHALVDEEVEEKGNEYSNVVEEMKKILPCVMKTLAEAGFDMPLVNFFRLVESGTYPFENIAFLLWAETVKWYSLENSSFMRYSDDTKKFWKLGYRLFGGRFVRFMSGFKHVDQVAKGETEKGIYSPKSGDINFAIPDIKNLRGFKPYDTFDCESNTHRAPGILNDSISMLAQANAGQSFCLTFDGKKLKSGLSKETGDVDILGFENNPLSERKENHRILIQPLLNVLDKIDLCETDKQLSDLDEDQRNELRTLARSVLTHVSSEILNIQALKKKKVYAKEKLIERGGESNWKNGKYAYAISSMIAFVHDIDKFQERAMETIDEVLKCICNINKSQLMSGESLNLLECSNFVELKDDDNTSSESRKVKQRSPAWFSARQQAKVTGSTIHKALGLDTLKSQKEFFDTKICGIPEAEKPEHVKSAMSHGTLNEQNALATCVGKVLPVIYPGTSVYEEGYIEMFEGDKDPFMIISPDGSVRNSETETVAALEFKCPVRDVHRDFPSRYLLQCLSEIEALDVDELIYICWRPDISSVFKVKRNPELFRKAYALAKQLYPEEKPKRPTRLCEETKQLQMDIKQESKSGETVDFITVVPSMLNDPTSESRVDQDVFRVVRLKLMLEETLGVYERYYELNRQPASEAVVFLCCDLDRKWKEGSYLNSPICWFPKGYSLDCETMRNILEMVLDTCHSKSIHIPAISFDGQWHPLCVRSRSGHPLTLFQLQKDVWKRAQNTPKAAILKQIRCLNNQPKWYISWVPDNNSRVIVTAPSLSLLPEISPSVAKQRRSEKEKLIAKRAKTESTVLETNVAEDGSIHGEEQMVLIQERVDVGNLETDIEPETIDSESELAEVNDCETDQDIENNLSIAMKSNSSDESSQKTETVDLSDEEAMTILKMLQVDEKCNQKGQWSNKSSSDVLEQVASMRDIELRIVVRYLNRQKLKIKINESASKAEKLRRLADLLHLPTISKPRITKKGKSNQQVKKLSELSYEQVSKSLRKIDLNIIYAEYLWPSSLKTWCDEMPSIQFNTVAAVEVDTQYQNICGKSSGVDGQPEDITSSSSYERNTTLTDLLPHYWFYSPELSNTRNQLEVSCVDSTHLLTRTRRKCCRGGLEGLPNSAWRRVALSGNTSLSLAMVDGLVEPMSVSIALTHFTKEVENEMRHNGDKASADLCHDIRNWWEAEDNPGISAKVRLQMRKPLRERLLGYVDFSRFPPHGMYVKGWPAQLWEALIANIDAKTILYGLCHGGRYNVRAFSSMMGETFFSELTMFDRRGQGTVTSAEFGQYINSSIEKLQMRLDPSRKFQYRTSSKTVYTLVDGTDRRAEVGSDHEEDVADNCFLDHMFDKPERTRLKGKRKEAVISKDRNAVKRGSLGVRWEGARRNEAKLLPTLRLGLDVKEAQ